MTSTFKVILLAVTLILHSYRVIGICSNLPSNWTPQNIATRATASPAIAYVKIREITSRNVELWGNTYSAVVDLICNVKADRGIILPLDFTIEKMGAQPNNCPLRDVVVGNNYIIFLDRGQVTPGVFTPIAVNQEQCVFDDSWDNLQALSVQLQHCLLSDGCLYVPPDWKPLSENERAKDAEIFVKAKIKSIHYLNSSPTTYTAVCELTCNMKQPSNMKAMPNTFNVTSLGTAVGQCAEHHVTPGFEFYMFLERHFPIFPLPGSTVPPHILDRYMLGVQEVNLQQGVMNVTDKMNEMFKEYTQSCPSYAHRIQYSLQTTALFLILCIVLLVS
ncbi:uncharacterized protein LOC100180302 [Ciona intestinalis]